MRWQISTLFLVIFASYVAAQIPPRLQIPGALLTSTGGGPRAAPRLRRPNTISNAREVRPVTEDFDEAPNYPSSSSSFDDEVNKLVLSSVRDNQQEQDDRPAPLPFRPERPVPVAREQIREKPRPLPPPRNVIRQDLRDSEPVIRQAPIRTQDPPAPKQTFRPQKRILTPEEEDAERDRRRKDSEVETLRKYRTDNEDGSITWGFELTDGTFKEETLGADCIIRGRYGYVDPDNVKREYSYESGLPCDQPEEEEELAPQKANSPQPRKPQPQYRPPVAQQQQSQYRPQGVQQQQPQYRPQASQQQQYRPQASEQQEPQFLSN
ncbi:translation initiation factor IF-2 isoform X1 [Cylas formicarius]|uniref:translation initiation factor IF-2 isoform X1 n=1 Tax=Cylas formicarius TaxID=197179 RepID=UPI002958CE39|nr:translation initiation factor IF-2 isoform X1 [Cylas formicarius]